MPKVDIVVPCYNYGRFLEACVRSVLDQSVTDLRVLIIDDASSDNSVAVANALAAADERVTVIAHAQNQGHIDTYNEGIAWARADYFLLLSADDLLVPGALERAIRVLDSNPEIVMTYGECITWNDQSPLPQIGGQPFSYYRCDIVSEMCRTASNLVQTPTAIVRTSTQKKIGGYRKSLPHAGDLEMWLRFGGRGPVAFIGAVQAIYRKHTTAMSNSYHAVVLTELQQRKAAFDAFLSGECDKPASERAALQRQVNRGLAEKAVPVAVKQLRHFHIYNGLRLFSWAIKLDWRAIYSTSLWRALLRIPGPVGRARAARAVKTLAQKLVALL